MKKADLKFGNVVETGDGIRYLYHKVTGNKLVNLFSGDTYLDLDDYNDILIMVAYGLEYQINKVYEDYTCKKLVWKRKDFKLTEDEKTILRNIEVYKYIARDEAGTLYVYYEKPEKDLDGEYWYGTSTCFDVFGHLFNFIKWEDKEPYLISDLLED